MRKDAEQEIEVFVNQIVERFSPERVVLFGSQASAKTTLESDVDLLVIMDFEGRPHEQAFEIRKAIKRSFPLDLIVRRPSDVEQRLIMGDFFMKDIIEEGKVLYERTGS